MNRINDVFKKNETLEIKQSFLSSAISDISSYIHLIDTKVSIILGALVALIAGLLACYEPIGFLIKNIKPCSWIGTIAIIFIFTFIISAVLVFIFSILTVRAHVSNIAYSSKWFITSDTKKYSFDAYLRDIKKMKNTDVIDNMAAELYKLNDIYRQKSKTMKWTIRFFTATISMLLLIGLMFLVNAM